MESKRERGIEMPAFTLKEEKELLSRRVGIEVKGPDEATISILRGGTPLEAQGLSFEGVRQLIFRLQDALQKMKVIQEYSRQ